MVSRRCLPLVLPILVDITSMLVVVSTKRWSIVPTMETPVLFASQRWGSSFTIYTLKLGLVMRSYFSMITSWFIMSHYMFRVGSWRISVHRVLMGSEIFLSRPVVRSMFSFNFWGRLRLTIIWCLSLPIWRVRISRRIPNIDCTRVVLKCLVIASPIR